MAKKRISDQDGRSYLDGLPQTQAMAVRYLLQLLEDSQPGGTIELRVPPYGAVQLVGGLSHRRGTPPNVVELGPDEFLGLAMGTISWEQLADSGQILVSGSRAAELRTLFPISLVR